jgi:hypothetical protein
MPMVLVNSVGVVRTRDVSLGLEHVRDQHL